MPATRYMRQKTRDALIHSIERMRISSRKKLPLLSLNDPGTSRNKKRRAWAHTFTVRGVHDRSLSSLVGFERGVPRAESHVRKELLRETLHIGRSLRTFFVIAVFALVACIPACGEPTDDPEDCTDGEFFDESSEQCQTCPAIFEPDCAPGCDFTVREDQNGCPEAVCNTSCGDTCPRGSFFSDDTLQCEACPGGPPATIESCQGLPCSCEPVTPQDPCQDMFCGECTSPDPGYRIDAVGRCVLEP